MMKSEAIKAEEYADAYQTLSRIVSAENQLTFAKLKKDEFKGELDPQFVKELNSTNIGSAESPERKNRLERSVTDLVS